MAGTWAQVLSLAPWAAPQQPPDLIQSLPCFIKGFLPNSCSILLGTAPQDRFSVGFIACCSDGKGKKPLSEPLGTGS